MLTRIREVDVQVRMLMRALFSEFAQPLSQISRQDHGRLQVHYWICESGEDTLADCLTQRNGCALRASGVGVVWTHYVPHPRHLFFQKKKIFESFSVFPKNRLFF